MFVAMPTKVVHKLLLAGRVQQWTSNDLALNARQARICFGVLQGSVRRRPVHHDALIGGNFDTPGDNIGMV